MEPQREKKIKFNRVYCQTCDKPSEYRAAGRAALYLKCWSCGEAIEAYSANLGKEVVWKEKEEYEAEQKRKSEEANKQPKPKQ